MLRSRRRWRKDGSRWKKENNPRKDIRRWSIKVYVCSIQFLLFIFFFSIFVFFCFIFHHLNASLQLCCQTYTTFSLFIFIFVTTAAVVVAIKPALQSKVNAYNGSHNFTLRIISLSLAWDVSSMKFCLCFDASPVVARHHPMTVKKKMRNCYSRRCNDKNHLHRLLSPVFVYGVKWISSKKSAHSPDR